MKKVVNHRAQAHYSNHKQELTQCLEEHGFNLVAELKSQGYKYNDTQESSLFSTAKREHYIEILSSCNSELMSIANYLKENIPLSSFAIRNHTCKIYEVEDKENLKQLFSQLVSLGTENYNRLLEVRFSNQDAYKVLSKFQDIKLGYYKGHGSKCLPVLLPAIPKTVTGVNLLQIAKACLLDGKAISETGKKVRGIRCLRTRQNLLISFVSTVLGV